MATGSFAVGVFQPKIEANIGSLYRSAYLYNAAFIFTVGRRYTQQASDTPKTSRHIPLFHFTDIDDLRAHLPLDWPLVSVELDERSINLNSFSHPRNVCYLLGAEDRGLPQTVLDASHAIVQIPTPKPQSMNVASAGAVLLYDRQLKGL